MINFVVALLPEAQPIIARWKLRKRADKSPFPTYHGDQAQLVISGMGKCNSAGATSWLAAQNDTDNDVWVNVGIAGHNNLPLGKLVTANKLTDHASGKSWYPTHIRSTLEQCSAITVDVPETNYVTDSVYDMEATGFFATALRFSTCELTHCLKVISDNTDNPIKHINPKLTKELIGSSLDNVALFCKTLHELSAECNLIDTSDVEDEFKRHFKFSVTQQHQLRRLLHRHYAVFGNIDALTLPPLNSTANRNHTKTLLEQLEIKINSGDHSR